MRLPALLLLIPVTSAIGAELIVNGGFEDPVLPPGNHYQVPQEFVPGWSIGGTTVFNIEIWSQKAPGLFSYEGNQHTEILGAGELRLPSGFPAPMDSTTTLSLYQTIPTAIGQSYQLSFYHSPRPGYLSTLVVLAGSTSLATFDENGLGLTELDWKLGSLVFVADSSATTITFSDTGDVTGAGTQLDLVSVMPIPEPGAWALFLGIIAIALTTRKRIL